MARPPAGRERGERTRAAILSAARKEFARSGFAGARIDDIARRAGVTKALIFYYFENKDGLSRAVSAQRLANYALPRIDGDGSRVGVGENLLQWPRWLFRRGEETLDSVRIALGEGISADVSRTAVFDETSRRESFQQQVARVRAAQQAGALPTDLDTAQLTFFLYILGVYPYMLPQGAYLITGTAPDDPTFGSCFERFLDDLAVVLQADQPCDGTESSPDLACETADADNSSAVSATETRDVTRERILAAALREFGLHGYRGARIDAIARRARVPRGLIAYYFGTKDGLFDAIATERAWSTERIQHQLQGGPDDPFAWSRGLFALGEPTVDWVHMLIWEGLDWEPGNDLAGRTLLMEDNRRGFWQRRIDAVRTYQTDGRLPPRIDPEQLAFFLWVLGLYPYLVPHIAYLITGCWPADDRFRAEFDRFVRALAGRMQPVRQPA